jgi:hypothetical protein
MQDFTHYSAAKRTGDKVVADLAKGQATALSPGQASDALAALQRLQRYYQDTGRRVSLLAGISEYCEAAGKLNGRTLGDAVDGFLNSVASVKRKDLGQAVEEFIESRRLKTIPRKQGERPELSPETHYQNSLWLREFGKTFPGHAVCDLTKHLIDKYMQNHSKVGPKTRNERRGVVKMFLRWCVKKDWLAPTHRLFEAVGFEHEAVTLGAVECYTAEELHAMLERASKLPRPPKDGQEPELDYRDLLPVIALAGLAGMRFKEITRMTFEEVFRRPDYIEIKAGEAKTRRRRLIDVCPALAAWLQPCRGRSGPVWPKGYDMLHEDFAALRESLEIPKRRNGLRHAFITAHYAAHSNEGLTARQAGNSPAMVHQHYNGLWTKAEGEAWFAVVPAQPRNVIQLGKVVTK